MWYTPTHLHTQRNIIPLQKERRACLLWQHGWRYCAKANKWGKEWHCMISFQVESKNVRLREQTGGCLRLRGGGIREMLVKGGTLPALRCMSDWVLGSNYSVVTVTDNTGLCTETLLRADLQSYHHTHMHTRAHTHGIVGGNGGVNQPCRGDHFSRYTHTKSPCCVPHRYM